MYDASLHPREEPPSLNLLDCEDADVYLDAVRDMVLETLAGSNLDGDDALLCDGFVYNMVLQHEAQHDETLRQTFGLMKGKGYRPKSAVELPSASCRGIEVPSEAGEERGSPTGNTHRIFKTSSRLLHN